VREITLDDIVRDLERIQHAGGPEPPRGFMSMTEWRARLGVRTHTTARQRIIDAERQGWTVERAVYWRRNAVGKLQPMMMYRLTPPNEPARRARAAKPRS